MSNPYNRTSSPTGRRLTATGRTSAGSVSGTPTYYEYPSSARSSLAGRASLERADVVHGLPVRQRSPPRRRREDDYDVKPRVRASSFERGQLPGRQQLALVNPKSPSRLSKPVIIKDLDKPVDSQPRGGGAQLEASYILPASSSGRHHHRHSSLTAGDRASRDHFREGYRMYPAEKSANQYRSIPRSVRDERDYRYEYTTPRAQVMRDLEPPAQRRSRRESHSGTRPTSMIDLDNSHPVYTRSDRLEPPSNSGRGLESVGRSGSLKHGGRTVANDASSKDLAVRDYPRDAKEEVRYRDIPRQSTGQSRNEYVPYPEDSHRRPKTRPGERDSDETTRRTRDAREERLERVNEHPRRHRDSQTQEDYHHHKGESLLREERDRHRDVEPRGDRDRRDREEPRRRRESGHEPDSHAGLLAAGGAAAVAGVAAEGLRRQRHNEEEQQPRQTTDQRRQNRDQQAILDDSPPDTKSRQEREDEDREERRRRRRREREKEEREHEQLSAEGVAAAETAESTALQRGVPPEGPDRPLREQHSYERYRDPDNSHRDHDSRRDSDGRRRRHKHRHRRHHRSQSRDPQSGQDGSSSSDSNISSDPIQRAPRVVSPPLPEGTRNGELASTRPPPKGILKPPRERFPEVPSSVREGVAPLDAAKKGIPAEARWTRINRRLVNPEALDEANVRYEAFADHVIVLKVLTPEEIQRFTQRTHEIRERRAGDSERASNSGGSVGSGSGSGNAAPAAGGQTGSGRTTSV